MWILYQIVLATALLLAAPILLLRRRRHYLPTLGGRLGGAEPSSATRRRHDVWLHAVSVGEVAIAATLVRQLPKDLTVLVTTVTATGQQRAVAALSKRATVAYLPFDLGFAIRRFFSSHRPASLVLVESELWPLLLRQCRKNGVPIYVINGRISDQSYRRMARLRPLLEALFRPVELFAVQTELDRVRYLELGVPSERVVVTGNLKYDSPEPTRHPGLEERITALSRGRPIVIAGSTMEGEDQQVLDAFGQVGGDQAMLILAPRHPERFDAVADLVLRSGLSLARRNGEGVEPHAATEEQRIDVFLLDSLGELASTYRLAEVGFIGGTLVATGGHNPLEAARFGKAIAVGPSMENFRQIADQFDHSRAWQRVMTSTELASVWSHWLDDPAAAAATGSRAKAVFELNGGALKRTLALLEPILSRPDPRGERR